MPARLSILYTAQASEQPSGWVTPCQSPFSAEKTCDNTFPSMKAQATEQLEHLPVPLAEPCAALRGGVRFAGSQEEQTALPREVVKIPTWHESSPCFKDFIQRLFQNTEAILEETM